VNNCDIIPILLIAVDIIFCVFFCDFNAHDLGCTYNILKIIIFRYRLISNTLIIISYGRMLYSYYWTRVRPEFIVPIPIYSLILLLFTREVVFLYYVIYVSLSRITWVYECTKCLWNNIKCAVQSLFNLIWYRRTSKTIWLPRRGKIFRWVGDHESLTVVRWLVYMIIVIIITIIIIFL